MRTKSSRKSRIERRKKNNNINGCRQTGSGKTIFLNAFINYLLGIKYEDETRTKLITYSKPSIPKECKKILLVEDMLESGKSIKWAYEYYSNQGYDVKTACLFIMKKTEFIPDFYIKTIDEKIRFPWEEEKPN